MYRTRQTIQHEGLHRSQYGIEMVGISQALHAYWNLPNATLYEHALSNNEAILSNKGPLVARTGTHTGRSPNDRFIVQEPETSANIWWGDVNKLITPVQFNALHSRVAGYIAGKSIYVFDGFAGHDPDFRIPVRIITEYAWHNLFARNMFVQAATPEELENHLPHFTVIDMPSCLADPDLHGTRSGTFIALNLAKRLVLIGGSEYAGEIKKSIFSALNYFLPSRHVLPMHCSANYGASPSDTAIFFGLSGTGKTTLSNDPNRTLIGDDEHGWSEKGVFNIEGGCYAKMIRLDPEGEPEIYATTNRFGTILENVVIDPLMRVCDLDDAQYTENTRGSYSLEQITHADLNGVGGHPRHVIFLTADAFGVLPPISKLSKDQALYHFMSGYTSKVAGTERGIIEPQATFSACFGAPFMPRHPIVYARMLGQRIEEHDAQVWLVNTGWIGGPYGVGRRIKLAYTRAMITAILTDALDEIEFTPDPYFGLNIPATVPDVPSDVLRPREMWYTPAEYDEQAQKLVSMFENNFKQFLNVANPEIIEAGLRAPTE